ncbi:hypothetical protein WJX72_012029 [[Myrmecia] bisecta]|uniref:HIG1 domain-containing protein n=1 Tax=[Myrmecia] bisecta TaxID=41462 RepID=A0AAW1Q8T3_9CHLO
MSKIEEARAWVKDHKIKAVGGFWLSSVVGAAAFQWSRPIPTQLKVIHTRVYAQALTLAALAMAGLVDVYEHRAQTSKVRRQ